MQPYVKQTWEDGVTVINKSRLDHIEEGIYQVSIVQPEKGDPGKDGITPLFQVAEDYIQVSTDNGASWSNLVPLSAITGPQGETGKAFSIYKTYPTIEAMNADAANVPEGSFVLIASTEDDRDNAKLYVKGADAFTYLTDMSGAQGIQGEPGKDGAPGVTPVITFHVTTLEAGSDVTVEQSGTAEAPSVTIGVPRGADGTNGQNGSDGVNGKDGATFTPSVDENANLSWTNNGGLENPPTVNIAPDLSDYVKYQEFVAGVSDKQRKTIQLANADSISGISTTGTGANLIMLSQWDKVDIGTINYQMNLNSPDGIVQINDEKVVATTDQIPSIEGLATVDELTQGLSEKQPVGDYATKSEIPDISGLATKEEVSQVEAKIPSVEGLATETALTEGLNSKTVTVGNVGLNKDTVEIKQGETSLAKLAIPYHPLKVNASLFIDDGSFYDPEGGLGGHPDYFNNTAWSGGDSLTEEQLAQAPFLLITGTNTVSGDSVTTETNLVSLGKDSALGKFYATKEELAGKADAVHTHEIADVTGLQALLDTLPVMIQIPIRTLQDKVYDQATIFGWFGVEDIAGLRGLFSSQHLLWLRYGISSMGVGHMMYRFVVEYAEVNADSNTVKLVFSGLNTNNDKLAKYEFTAKLDGTLVSGNSNVQLTVTDKE